MDNNSYKKNMKNFSMLIECIKSAMKLDSFSDVRDEYNIILNEIISWVKDYRLNKNFNHITYSKSLKIHELIDDIREKKLFDKNIGIESEISDEILIWYEVLIKSINDERSKVDE